MVFMISSILDKRKCIELKKFIDRHRPCNKNIFYNSKKEFIKKGKFKNYSPGEKSHNAIYNLNINLDFIEKSKNFIRSVESIVGKNYSIKKKSIIRSVPKNLHPSWASDITKDIGRPNVNPYIKREFQDVQYFQNIDFHQDMTRGKNLLHSISIWIMLMKRLSFKDSFWILQIWIYPLSTLHKTWGQ